MARPSRGGTRVTPGGSTSSLRTSRLGPSILRRSHQPGPRIRSTPGRRPGKHRIDTATRHGPPPDYPGAVRWTAATSGRLLPATALQHRIQAPSRRGAVPGPPAAASSIRRRCTGSAAGPLRPASPKNSGRRPGSPPRARPPGREPVGPRHRPRGQHRRSDRRGCRRTRRGPGCAASSSGGWAAAQLRHRSPRRPFMVPKLQRSRCECK